MQRILAIGECMIELRHQDERRLILGYAGDTWNTALYMARYQAEVSCQVDYMTALGTDPYSEAMLSYWQSEGIGCQYVRRIPNRIPGLYLIRTTPEGERTFFYYRHQAAVRVLFQGDESQRLLDVLPQYHGIYLSGITLALFDQNQLDRLIRALQNAKDQGSQIWFDPNYRANLWDSHEQAAETMRQVWPLANILLTTLGDESQLHDIDTPKGCFEYYQKVPEVVIKMGGQGAVVHGPEGECPIKAYPAKVKDTTAAGDSFNAAYLLARMKGLSQPEAGEWGAQLAAKVVEWPGAILERGLMPELG